MRGLAWTVLILNIIAFILSPLMIGRDRGEYTYAHWIGNLAEIIMVGLLALRVLNLI